MNRKRSNYEFANIAGEDHAYADCDFEITEVDGNKVVEIRKVARGNVARSIFYMEAEYDLPIPEEMRELMLKWNKDDEPTCNEMRRNNKIEELQGTRNRFIDHPVKAQ